MRLLDFGCGPGTITIDLAEHLLPNGSVVGIDNSSTVIDQARVRLDQKGTQNVSFEVRSIYETGYGAKSQKVVKLRTRLYKMGYLDIDNGSQTVSYTHLTLPTIYSV